MAGGKRKSTGSGGEPSITKKAKSSNGVKALSSEQIVESDDDDSLHPIIHPLPMARALHQFYLNG